VKPSESTKNSFDPTSFIPIAAIAFSLWYLILGYQIESHQPELPYYVTEWMVTFSSGFVRRGVLGQTFWSLGSVLHTPPLLLIQYTRFALDAAFLSLVGALCYKNRRALGLVGGLVILANPLIAFYAWVAPGSLDLLFLFVTAAHLLIAASRTQHYLQWSAALFATAGVYLVLSHEAFLFLCLPINIVIAWRKLSNTQDSIPQLMRQVVPGKPFIQNSRDFKRLAKALGFIFAMPIIAALVASRFHGTPEQSVQIARAWGLHGVEVPKLSAIDWLKANLLYELTYVAKWMDPLRLFNWALATMVCVVPLVILWLQFLKSATTENRQRLIVAGWDFLGVPLLCTIPLYFIGTDWHRWLALPFAIGIVCILMCAPPVTPFEADRRMNLQLLGLIIVCLVKTPAALYYSPNASSNGLLISTKDLISPSPSKYSWAVGQSKGSVQDALTSWRF
jgi:hypothetical protein